MEDAVTYLDALFEAGWVDRHTRALVVRSISHNSLE